MYDTNNIKLKGERKVKAWCAAVHGVGHDLATEHHHQWYSVNYFQPVSHEV